MARLRAGVAPARSLLRKKDKHGAKAATPPRKSKQNPLYEGAFSRQPPAIFWQMYRFKGRGGNFERADGWFPLSPLAKKPRLPEGAEFGFRPAHLRITLPRAIQESKPKRRH